MSIYIPLVIVADPVNFTSEFWEKFEATLCQLAGNSQVKVMAVHLLS
jgi:hypothetical protein